MSFFYAPSANYVQTTLNGALTSGAGTITLNSTANLPLVGYVVIDRQDSSGNNTPNSREVVSYTGISGSNLTGCTRAADNSTARSHNDGALVETMPTVGMYNSLVSPVATLISSDGALNAYISPVSIARVESNTYAGAKGHFLWIQSGALATSLATSTNNAQIPFLRATKNLTLSGIYIGLNSAPSLAPFQMDLHSKASFATGPTGPSIFSVKPLIGLAFNDNSGATPGTLSLTSLASGTLLYPEILQPGGSGDLTIQLIGVER